jgi:8-oxo-dGTP pyrophosphatase MutT (NUDIX family)
VHLRLREVLERLGSRIGPLPGLEAQVRMAPMPRHGWKPGFEPGDARPAAGLILLYPVNDEATVLLTKRSAALPQHSGQVSLPGGAVDPGESIETAALREAFEEVGLNPAAVRVLGLLTPLPIPVSGFVLHPVIGTTEARPPIYPASAEVDRLIEIPLAHLVDPGRHRRTMRTRDGIEFDMPFFDVGGEQVWGATAMVLAEFVALLGVLPTP